MGTSLAQTMQERRDQFHTLRLGQSFGAFNAAVVFSQQARKRSLSRPAIQLPCSSWLSGHLRLCITSEQRHDVFLMIGERHRDRSYEITLQLAL